MSAHLFISPFVPQPRWSEAFPQARFFSRADELPRQERGDIVWLAAEVPGWRSVLAHLRSQMPEYAVVVLSLQPDAHEGLAALELGARGYCHGLASAALLTEVAEVVRRGGLWVGPDLMQRLVIGLQGRLSGAPRATPAPGLSALSTREREVAEEVAAGKSNKEVARALDITERTVKAHLSSVFDKLGVRDRVQLVLRLGAASRSVEEAG